MRLVDVTTTLVVPASGSKKMSVPSTGVLAGTLPEEPPQPQDRARSTSRADGPVGSPQAFCDGHRYVPADPGPVALLNPPT